MALKRVKKLTVTFLVDNSIEWFTKLPPGFTHELKLHIGEGHAPVDPVTGVPVIDFENYCCGAHGFSALIETQAEDSSESHFTLFDTGPESKSITRNIASLRVPVERIERVVLSHWHSDHSGGILAFLRARQSATGQKTNCVVDLHPDRPIARGIAPGGPDKVVARLAADPTFEAIEELRAVVETHREGHTVADDTVWISGEIPRVVEFEKGLLGGVRWVQDAGAQAGATWVIEEHIMDERYAAIDVIGKGLVIFSSCSHAGIVNVVTDAVKTFKRPIHMIIGGLHLGTPDLVDRIEPTVDFFASRLRPSPTYILPMHCTGFGAKIALERALGEACVPAGTGMRVQIDGTPEAEKAMFAPVIV